MIDRIYDTDGVYLGVIFERDGWYVAEDRIVVTWRHKHYESATNWLRVRRALTLGRIARTEEAV